MCSLSVSLTLKASLFEYCRDTLEVANTYYIGLDGNQAHQNFQGTPGERTEQAAAEGAADEGAAAGAAEP